MRWRKFDGTTIEIPILDAVASTLARERDSRPLRR